MFKTKMPSDNKKDRKGNPFASQPGFDEKHRMYPAGDYYGTGFRAKFGSIRDSKVESPIPQHKLNTDPRSLA